MTPSASGPNIDAVDGPAAPVHGRHDIPGMLVARVLRSRTPRPHREHRHEQARPLPASRRHQYKDAPKVMIWETASTR